MNRERDICICTLAELADGAAIARDLQCGEDRRPLIVARLGDEVRAFLNSCPHTGVRLDWQPGHFLDLEGTHLQCATHGARFERSHGLCIEGPCRGQRLVRVQVVVRAGAIYVRAPDAIPASAVSRR